MIPIEHIKIAVANEFGVASKDLSSPSRTASLVRARQAVMFLAKREGYALTEIGGALGGRDHSTISHGIGKTALRMVANKTFAQRIIAINAGLKQTDVASSSALCFSDNAELSSAVGL